MQITIKYQPQENKIKVRQDSFIKKMLIQMVEHDRARALSFRIVDKENCKHRMVYEKNTDEMHCNSCDVFMYRNYGDL